MGSLAKMAPILHSPIRRLKPSRFWPGFMKPIMSLSAFRSSTSCLWGGFFFVGGENELQKKAAFESWVIFRQICHLHIISCT